MKSHSKTEIGCSFIGEFGTENATKPANEMSRGEPVCARLIPGSTDPAWPKSEMREFIVLLEDGRVLTVHGHCLKHEPCTNGMPDSYGVFVRTDNEELLIAIFRSDEVSGIFCGDMQSDRKIA